MDPGIITKPAFVRPFKTEETTVKCYGYTSPEAPVLGPTLWNHSIAGSYTVLDGIIGVELYAGRVLALTRPHDVLQLPIELQDDYNWVAEHYKRLGLDVTSKVEWDLSHNVARLYPDYRKELWLYGPEADALSPNPSRLRAVAQLNDKNWFMAWCQKNGWPVPPTRPYRHGQKPSVAFLQLMSFLHTNRSLQLPVFVKGAVAASGEEVIRCNTWREIAPAVHKMSGDFQLQQGMDVRAFLNVQYFAHAGTAEFMATTEQVLDGFTHVGNRYPSSHDPRTVTDPIAQASAKMGIEGVFAFDVLVLHDGAMLVLECNPRPNGATYPTVVAWRLGIGDWMSLNVTTRYRSFDEIDFGSCLFDPAAGTGVVVVNWGPIRLGKFQVLVAGTPSQQQAFIHDLKTRLGGEY